MSSLIYGIRKIVSQKNERASIPPLPALLFAEAYEELRRSCPEGDVTIYLYVENPPPGSVQYADEKPCFTCMRGRVCLEHPRGQ